MNQTAIIKGSILVVDDSESIREIISLGLTGAGYQVVAGVDGADGMQQLQKTPGIRLVISDLNMPGMDGLSFLRAIRKTDEFRYLPVIIVTTESQLAKKMEAKNAGATGWIIKPFAKEKLLEVVKKVLG